MIIIFKNVFMCYFIEYDEWAIQERGVPEYRMRKY